MGKEARAGSPAFKQDDMIGGVRYVLTYTFHDMDGKAQHRSQNVRDDDDPQEAYERKMIANEYFVGGAFNSNLKLWKVTETWERVPT